MNVFESVRAYIFKKAARGHGYGDVHVECLWNYYQRLKNYTTLQRFVGKGVLSCDKELLFGTSVLFTFLSDHHVEWYIKKLEKSRSPRKARQHLKDICHSLIATMTTVGYINREAGDWPEAFDDAAARILAEVLTVQIGEESVETYTDMLKFNIRRHRRTVR